MNKDAAWLLSLEPDRFLNRFKINAGLKPKGEIYAGWEALGVSRHSLGHYLSACSIMYAATGNRQFKQKTGYIAPHWPSASKPVKPVTWAASRMRTRYLTR